VRDRDGRSHAQERDGDGKRFRRRGKKGLIEAAHAQDGLSVWTEDEAPGPKGCTVGRSGSTRPTVWILPWRYTRARKRSRS